MNHTNLQMLDETMRILEDGAYTVNNKRITLPHTREEQSRVTVYLPEDIDRIRQTKRTPVYRLGSRVGVACKNADTLAAARSLLAYKRYWLHGKKNLPQEVLVLNFANPFEPGGGVRRGAKAQEEDLCCKSSLLFSLDSEAAAKYYAFHREKGSQLSSDAIMITPYTDVFRDENGALLEEPFTVAVMTCAAPMAKHGREDMQEEAYRALFARRIDGMLQVAAYLGYQALVLGAFGCGAFGNDAAVVSDLFYQAMRRFQFSGMYLSDCFCRIDFAVLSRSENQYNLKEFQRNFSDYYREENDWVLAQVQKRIQQREKHLDAIRGCLIGGAAGDALGYPVEFFGEDAIFDRYGADGIQAYTTDRISGKALISDDTQMTLFTAVGLLYADTRRSLRGIGADLWVYVERAYQDWLLTQKTTMEQAAELREQSTGKHISWLLDVPALFARRAPGNTCLTALESGAPEHDVLTRPRNNSKGCGGVMRIAPVALVFPSESSDSIDEDAACVAAITHGHSLGWLPATALAHVIRGLVFDENAPSLQELAISAQDALRRLFGNDPNTETLCSLLNMTIKLSENDEDDLTNIHRLGEGWVGEEALAIALYCCLRHPNDFSKAIAAAVNHRGDSDSTGAIAGNILGAKLGYAAIDEKWKKDLELHDVILEVADDLCHGCQMSEYSPYRDLAWEEKYIHGRRFRTE